MFRILIYTFFKYHSISYKVLNSLQDVDKQVISNRTNLDKFASEIISKNYSVVIGLGDFMKTAKRIRFENRFINRYGTKIISKDSPHFIYSTLKYAINDDYTYISDKPSWGPCNKSAYVIAVKTKIENTNIKVGFIHIPKSFDLLRANSIVKEVIELNSQQ